MKYYVLGYNTSSPLEQIASFKMKFEDLDEALQYFKDLREGLKYNNIILFVDLEMKKKPMERISESNSIIPLVFWNLYKGTKELSDDIVINQDGFLVRYRNNISMIRSLKDHVLKSDNPTIIKDGKTIVKVKELFDNSLKKYPIVGLSGLGVYS